MLPLAHLIPAEGRRFLAAVWDYRRGISVFVGAVTAVAVAVALLLPSWYTATSSILPPSDTSDSFGMMTSMIQTSALNSIGLLSTQTPSDVVAEILKSRTLREEIIRRHDLMTRYRAKSLDLALKELEAHVGINVNKAGLITVSVEDRDPEKAAAMANDMVELLDKFNRETLNTKAKRSRAFLEERLTDVRGRLASAESTLTSYEKRNKMVASTEAGAIGAIATVMAERMNLQVRRSYMASFTQPGSPALKEIDAQMNAYERQLGQLPSLKQEGSRLLLDAEIHRRVFTLLTAQYEDARLEELRDTPTLTVLDAARAPSLRSRPRRSLIVLAAAGLAVALSLLWVSLERRQPAAA